MSDMSDEEKVEAVYQAALELLTAFGATDQDKQGLHKFVKQMDANNYYWRRECEEILTYVNNIIKLLEDQK